MSIYCREDSLALIRCEIDAYKTALGFIDGIIEVVKSFDGKVMNVRFERALQEKVNKCIYAHTKSWGYFEIYYSIENRSVKSVKGEGWNYIEYHNLSYVCGEPEELFGENKRINADDLIQQIEKSRAELKKNIEELENAIPKIDEWVERKNGIAEQIRILKDEIPYAVRSYVSEFESMNKWTWY